MLTKNNHLKRKHQNDGNAEDGGHAEKRLKEDKTSEEEKQSQLREAKPAFSVSCKTRSLSKEGNLPTGIRPGDEEEG